MRAILLIAMLILATPFAYGVEYQGVPADIRRDLEKHFSLLSKEALTLSEADQIIRYLYQTGRFESVWVETDQGKMTVAGKTIRTIREIDFQGNRDISRRLLRDLLSVDSGERYDRIKLQEGKSRIMEYYQIAGYSNTQVHFQTQTPTEDQLDLKVIIEEGKISLIESIEIESSNPRFKRQMKSELRKYIGRSFTDDNLQRMRTRFEEYFVENMFLKAQLEEPTVEHREVDGRGRAIVRFKIRDPYRYELDLVGYKSFSLPALLRAIELEKYDRTSLDPALEIGEKIRQKYLASGFPEIKVEATVATYEKDFLRRIKIRILENQRSRIATLDVQGRISRPSQYYSDFIRSHSSTLIESGFFNKRDVELGYQNLEVELKNQGFIRARVQSARFEFNRDRTWVNVLVIVDEGPLTLVTNVNFEGNAIMKSATLQALIPIKINSPLRLNQIEPSIQKLTQYYRDKGYLEMRVLNQDQSLVSYNDANTQADLNFKIYEGPQVKIAGIIVEGNEKTNEDVVLREAGFKIGETLTPDMIEDATQRLQKMGLFTSVEIRTLEEGSPIANRTLVIRVYEANPGYFSIGIGVNSERRLTLRGFTGIGYKNLGGTGRAISSRVELSSNVYDVRFLEHKVNAGYLEPFLFNTRNRGRVNLSRSQSVTNVNEDEIEGRKVTIDESNRLEFLIDRDLNSHTRLSWLLWSLDIVRRFERDDKFPENKQQIAAIGPMLRIDHSDNPLLPTKGGIFTADIEYSNPSLGSSDRVEYIRSSANLSKYTRLGSPRWVWANSISGGYVENLSNKKDSGVPSTRAFFLGGDSTIRGFDQTRGNERIPDQDELPVSDEKFLIIPESSYFYMFKSEIRFPLYKDFGGAFFYDGGAVFVKDANIRDNYRDAIGFGLRYNTPFGPIRGDLGYKLDRKRNEKQVITYITIGTF